MFHDFSFDHLIDVLIKKNVSSYILQGPPCIPIHLKSFNTILTFGGSHLFKVLKRPLSNFFVGQAKEILAPNRAKAGLNSILTPSSQADFWRFLF